MTSISSNLPPEARWKSYTKAAAALLPAVAACLVARTFILPKVEQIWADAGFGPEAPLAAAVAVLNNVGPALLSVAIAFGLVEWCWRGGARFRGALTTSAVVLLNAAAFFGIIALCIAAILVVPNMRQRGGPAATPAVMPIIVPANL